MGECGEIERLSLLKNDEGNIKGIAFIQFKSSDAIEKALKYDSQEYGGRTIYVSKAGDGGKGGKDGKDGKGKGKDGKDKGKGKKGKSKGKLSSENKAKHTGGIVESTGEKKTFEDSD